jgi:hypothetical protein
MPNLSVTGMPSNILVEKDNLIGGIICANVDANALLIANAVAKSVNADTH